MKISTTFLSLRKNALCCTAYLSALIAAAGLLLAAPANGQTAQWVRQAGTGGITNGVSTDASGNVYFTGIISNPGLFENISIPCHASDVFVAKYDAAGALVWAKVNGGELLDQANDIATDAKGQFLCGRRDPDQWSLSDRAI